MSTTIIDTYSDIDMACPAGYENGFKEARIISADTADRALSDLVTGDWEGSTFRFGISDYDRRFREQLASLTDRYWIHPLTVKMTTRANRAALGAPYTVFVGPIVDAQPTGPMAWDITLGDIVSQGLLSDQGQQPWRMARDGFVYTELTAVSEHFDSETPEPIVYGQHRRVPDVDEPSPFGFCLAPSYLGIMDVNGNAYHVWLVAGHACAAIPTIRVDGVEKIADEGTEWLVPHYGGHAAAFDGNPYNDFTSSTYGNTRRYTLVFGKVTDLTADPDDLTDPDACALGHKQLTVAVDGIEPSGTGIGAVITDRIQQYKHFLINYVANRGPESYQSGAWLSNPTWNIFDATVTIVEESSFDACSAIAALRLPAIGSPPIYEAGYIGAAVIGARPGDQSSIRKWISDWNRSCGVRFGITHLGRMRIVMLSPTEDIKAAAPLYDDVTHILKESFETRVHWDAHANRIPFRADYEHATGVWKTSDTATWDESVVNYAREILGRQREYPFAPGITMAYHLARLEALQNQHPPRTITLKAPVGPDENGDSLGYLDLGDYVRYRHFSEVGTSSTQIRLAQVVRHQVLAGTREVQIEALDCDDFIGTGTNFGGAESFDRPPATETPGGDAIPERDNQTRAEAIVISPYANTYELTIDTTNNGTDPEVSGSPALFCGSSIAYHAAWWTLTPNANKEMSFSTLGSTYDTTIAVFTSDGGSPAVLTLVGCNDNLDPLFTSVLTLNLVAGTQYFILVSGHNPEDSGILKFKAVAPEVGDIYVSTTGSDGAVGEIDTPVRHIAEALSRASAGTTIIVRGGTYDETLINNLPSGTSWTNKVRIAAYPGEAVWLRPTGSGDTAVLVENASYIEFDGVNIDVRSGFYSVCVSLTTTSHHIRMMNAEFIGEHREFGYGQVSADGPSCELINLTIHGGGVNDFHHGIYASADYVLIDGCEIYDIPGCGITSYKSGGSPLGGTIRNCLIHTPYPLPTPPDDPFTGPSGQRHVGIQICGTGLIAYNNVVHGINEDLHGDGIQLYFSTGTELYHNTVYGCVRGFYLDTSTNATVQNNVAYQNNTNYSTSGDTGTTEDHNLRDGTNPLFVNTAGRNFRLQSGSPAIDSGTTVAAVTSDKDGIPRPQGAAPDIGAYEFVG